MRASPDPDKQRRDSQNSYYSQEAFDHLLPLFYGNVDVNPNGVEY